jgi:hypothetical protein
MIFLQKVKRPWIFRSNGVWQLADFVMNCDRSFFVELLVDPREGWVARRVFWTQFDKFDHGDLSRKNYATAAKDAGYMRKNGSFGSLSCLATSIIQCQSPGSIQSPSSFLRRKSWYRDQSSGETTFQIMNLVDMIKFTRQPLYFSRPAHFCRSFAHVSRLIKSGVGWTLLAEDCRPFQRHRLAEEFACTVLLDLA